MHDSMQELQKKKKKKKKTLVTVTFQLAISWTDVENAALPLALFIATCKILHFILVNPHVQILARTIFTARHDIFSFCCLSFVKSVFSFSSIPCSLAYEFDLSLGKAFDFVETMMSIEF